MGIYRTSELVEESLSKMRWKKGVSGNGTSMYGFFFFLVEYELAKRVKIWKHFTTRISALQVAKWAITKTRYAEIETL